jgi:hypothetical protein
LDRLWFFPGVAKYAGMWVRIPRADRDYSTVAAGVRLSSTLDELKVWAPY